MSLEEVKEQLKKYCKQDHHGYFFIDPDNGDIIVSGKDIRDIQESFQSFWNLNKKYHNQIILFAIFKILNNGGFIIELTYHTQKLISHKQNNLGLDVYNNIRDEVEKHRGNVISYSSKYLNKYGFKWTDILRIHHAFEKEDVLSSPFTRSSIEDIYKVIGRKPKKSDKPLKFPKPLEDMEYKIVRRDLINEVNRLQSLIEQTT